MSLHGLPLHAAENRMTYANTRHLPQHRIIQTQGCNKAKRSCFRLQYCTLSECDTYCCVAFLALSLNELHLCIYKLEGWTHPSSYPTSSIVTS